MNKKGISLIVLVITIIVMIILATAIILSLESSGIIEKATKAKTDSDVVTLKEAASVSYAEYILEKNTGENVTKTAEEYVKDKLKEKGFTNDKLTLIEVTEAGKITVYKEPKVPNGFTKSIYEGEKTIGEGLVIYKTDEATLKTKTQEYAQKSYDQFVWVPVTDMSTFTRTAWSNNVSVTGLSSYYTEPSSYNASTAYQYATEVAEYNAMKASVQKYGGFYIARYEAGDGDAERARENYTTGAHTVVIRKGAYVYNYVGWGDSMTDISSDVIDSSNNNKGKGAVYLSQNMYSGETNKNYTTSLIYGVQWDAALRWLSDKYNVSDSRSWGNYNNSTGEAATNSGSSNMNYEAGRSEAWKAKNIYDLAGNVWEWTMEANASDDRVHRGGYFGYNGDDIPAARRGSSGPDYANYFIGFRPALYLN